MPSWGPLGSSRAFSSTRRVPGRGSQGSTPRFAFTSSTYPTPSAGARSTRVSSARASWNARRPTRSGEGGGASSGWRAWGCVAHANAKRGGRTKSRTLRTNLDRRPVIDELPDLVHLVVGHRDAAVGPVEPLMRVSDPARRVRQPVDHHATARRESGPAREVQVLLVRVRDVQREVEAALRAARRDDLAPVRRAPGPLVALGAPRVPAERDAVLAQHAVTAQEQEPPRSLQDQDEVRLAERLPRRRRVGRRRPGSRAERAT